MVETLNQGTITIAGIVILLGLVGWVVWLKYKNPEITIGEVINILVLKEKVSIFIFANIIVNLASAIVAASIHPHGEAQVNTFARLLVHGSISLAGIVCNIIAPVLVILVLEEISEQRSKKKKEASWFKAGGMFFLTLVLAFGSIAFPLLNLSIIAGGLRELDKLYCLINYCQGYGGMYAFQQMTYIMQAEVGAMIAHYFLAAVDALWIAISPHAAMQEAIRQSVVETAKGSKGGGGSKADKNVDKNKEKKEKKDADNLEAGIIYMLKRRGYKDKALNDKVELANKTIDKMSAANRNKVAQAAAKLVSDIKTWDDSKEKKEASAEKVQEKNQLFDKRIYDLFAGSDASGDGFGFQLKKKKHEKN